MIRYPGRRTLPALLLFTALFCTPGRLPGANEYVLGPDSQPQPGVPQGKLTKHTWTSKIFPGTVRDYHVYVPAQYRPGQPASVMVFQDGTSFVREQGRWRVPIVFDNLIHKQQMPVTIGIFIDPGVLPALSAVQQPRFNRSFEYDALGDRYARFLSEEIMPEVARQYTLTTDPNQRAIAGSSSGAIAAFTVAWNRPDQFRRVLSFIGSYTNLRGGHNYPSLIRKTEPKPLRVYLQDGTNDLDIYSGSWFVGNQDMAAALKFAGYDYTFTTGTEAHNDKHGSAILPDALRWLWRDWQQPIAKGKAVTDQRAANAIIGGEWELVSEGHTFTEGPAVDKAGNVYFTDVRQSRIHKIGTDGKVSVFVENSNGASGMMFGPDGLLYACQNAKERLVAFSPAGQETPVTTGVNCNDLAVTPQGGIYFTDPSTRKIWYLPKDGERRAVHEGLEFPNGVVLSPDQSLLWVVDMRNKWVWSFQIQADGSLAHGQPFVPLATWDENSQSGGDGLTVDSEGYLYVATRLGVQVIDQPGRVVAILNNPHTGRLTNLVYGGPDLRTLYLTAEDKVYKRRMNRQGVWPWQVTALPKPRL